MGVYTRRDSPFYWMWLEGDGRRLSTGIPIGLKHQRTDSRRQAADIYLAAMGDIARQKFDLPVSLPARTFRAHAEWYRDTIASQHRGKRRAASMVNQLIAHFGDAMLSSLDVHAIEEWKHARANAVARQTVNRELDVLKPLLRSAVPKFLTSSPADQVKRFAVRRFAPITLLTREDEAKLLAVATPEERAFILLGTDTLMRLGDVRTFRVNFNHGAFIEVQNTKTGEATKVPTSTRLREALAALEPKDGWYFARRYYRKGPKQGTWQPISENTAWEMFADLCTRAGVLRGRDVKGITFHGLRHTGATRAMKKTKATAVMKLGGWTSLKQLVRYDHPDDPDLIAGVEAISGSRLTHTKAKPNKKAPKNGRS